MSDLVTVRNPEAKTPASSRKRLARAASLRLRDIKMITGGSSTLLSMTLAKPWTEISMSDSVC